MTWVTKVLVGLTSALLALSATARTAEPTTAPAAAAASPARLTHYTSLQLLDLDAAAPIGTHTADQLAAMDEERAGREFQTTVVEDLIDMLSTWPALLADEWALGPPDEPIDTAAVIKAILETDSSEWGDAGPDVEVSDAADDEGDAFGSYYAAIGGVEGPFWWSGQPIGALTAGGRLGFFTDLGVGSAGSSGRPVLTGMADPDGLPRIKRHRRTSLASLDLGPHAWHVPSDGSLLATKPTGKPAANTVPLPRGAWGAGLALAAALACYGRRSTHNTRRVLID